MNSTKGTLLTFLYASPEFLWQVADIDGGVVKLKLEGNCGTCPSSTMTVSIYACLCVCIAHVRLCRVSVMSVCLSRWYVCCIHGSCVTEWSNAMCVCALILAHTYTDAYIHVHSGLQLCALMLTHILSWLEAQDNNFTFRGLSHTFGSVHKRSDPFRRTCEYMEKHSCTL